MTPVIQAGSDSPEGNRSPTIVLTFCWSIGIPGGVGRHLQELSRALAEGGAKVIVVSLKTMRYSRFPRPKLPEHYQALEIGKELAELGVEILRPAPHPLHWMFDAGVMKREVAKLLATRKVDAVLSIYHEAAFLPELCAAHGVPWGVIATWQSYADALDQECKRPGPGGKLRKRLFERNIMASHRRAQLIFANSNFTVNELRDVLGVNVDAAEVTYLGVDPKFATVKREERDAVRRLLFFGRIVEEKGIFDGVRALAKLKEEGYDDWELRVVGTGDKPRLRQALQHLGLEDRVEILNFQDDQGLLQQFAWADLALLPSHSESFGLAIAEANCAGLPVVGFAAGSVPEVVLDGKTAWLAPLGDVDALAHCIRSAMDDPAEAHRRGLAGRERVLKTFRWDLTAEKILKRVKALAKADNKQAS